jgi:hypothetical protein
MRDALTKNGIVPQPALMRDRQYGGYQQPLALGATD